MALIHPDARLIDALDGHVLAGDALTAKLARAAEALSAKRSGVVFARFPTDVPAVVRYLGAWEAHRQVGQLASVVVDLLVVVGEGARGIATGAREGGLPPQAVLEVRDRDSALDELLARLRPGDVVLVKASRGAELDLLVDRLARSAGVSAA
jgi:hypothetical protein